jgi:putative transposase
VHDNHPLAERFGKGQLKELKWLQKENERLRKAVSDLTLDKLILAEAA